MLASPMEGAFGFNTETKVVNTNKGGGKQKMVLKKDKGEQKVEGYGLNAIEVPMKPQKTSKGKQKIEIKRVEKKSNRQVTFSRRRQGLFKKCDSLCSLFEGTQVAVITFSQAGKLFPYGNPSSDTVIQRFLNDPSNTNHRSLIHSVNYCNNDNCYKDAGASSSSGTNNSRFWWEDVQVDNLGLGQLEEFRVALENLRNGVVSRVEQIMMSHASMSSIPQTKVEFKSN